MAQGINNVSDNDTTSNQHVTIGVLVGFDRSGRPLVAFSNNPQSTAMPALYTLPLSHDNVGGKVALVFVDGNIEQPMILGSVKDSLKEPQSGSSATITVDEKDSLTLTAKRQVTLQCGDSSITLTKDGKIIVRGNYISSRATGMQTIKGGSVQIN